MSVGVCGGVGIGVGASPGQSKNSMLRYSRAPDDNRPVDVRAVEALLSERLASKMQRDFTRADQLRDELKAVYNVEVHDTERVWHVSRNIGGGSQFSELRGRPPPPARDRSRSPSRGF